MSQRRPVIIRVRPPSKAGYYWVVFAIRGDHVAYEAFEDWNALRGGMLARIGKEA